MICSAPLLINTFIIVTELSQLTDKTEESAMTLAKYFMVMFWCFSFYVSYSGLNAVIYIKFDQKIIAFYKNCFARKTNIQGQQTLDHDRNLNLHAHSNV